MSRFWKITYKDLKDVVAVFSDEVHLLTVIKKYKHDLENIKNIKIWQKD